MLELYGNVLPKSSKCCITSYIRKAKKIEIVNVVRRKRKKKNAYVFIYYVKTT